MLRRYALVLIIALQFSNSTYENRVNVSEKIVNGFPCSPLKYPYLISLKSITSEIFCGGSLLNRLHVLTAGHCCDYRTNNQELQVFSGLSQKRSFVQYSKVWKRFIHPYLDLCVLKLLWAIEQNSYTRFAKLATPKIFEELMRTNSCEKSITMGFGYQGPVQADNKDMPSIYQMPTLQCVEQKVLYTCPMQMEGILCVVGANHPYEDACFGDSGGPLICKGIQIGFVSSGIGCGLGFPSQYVNVASVYDFIMEKSGSNGIHIKIIIVSLILLFICFT